MFKILFVCTGNICRSPTADGIMKKIIADNGLSNKVIVDSAGTHGYHVNSPPDNRATATAKANGIDISNLRARMINTNDFLEFDIMLAMDRGHLEFMQQMQPSASKAKIDIFLNYAQNIDEIDVPDPYYGTGDGFQYVFDLIQNGCDGLLKNIKQNYIK